MKNHFLLRSYSALLATLPFALLAQEGSTPGGQYYIHGIFNPTIADVQKVDRRPQVLDTVLPERVVTYQVIPTQARLPIKVDSIAPAKLGISQTNERLRKRSTRNASHRGHHATAENTRVDRRRSRPATCRRVSKR